MFNESNSSELVKDKLNCLSLTKLEVSNRSTIVRWVAMFKIPVSLNNFTKGVEKGSNVLLNKNPLVQ